MRGDEIAMIFQDPLSSLHPVLQGRRASSSRRSARTSDVSKAAARDRAIELLGLVGIPEPRRRVDAYPHEFSGGMRQRAMIAMALVNEPKLLIADEPTTALDVTVQAQILELLARLQRRARHGGRSSITHDLGVVAEMADDDRGDVRRAGSSSARRRETIFAAPEHPYTWGLLRSIPRLDAPRGEALRADPGPAAEPDHTARAAAASTRAARYVREPRTTQVDPALEPVPGDPAPPRGLPARPDASAGGCAQRRCAEAGMAAERHERGRCVEVRDLVKHFPLTQGIVFQRQIGAVHAVDGVSLRRARGRDARASSGETGCGKTTTARLMLRLLDPTAGIDQLRGRGHRRRVAARG